MKKLLIILFCLFAAQYSFSQSADELYKTGDSLLKAKDYKTAAQTFEKAIEKQGKDAELNWYWKAANSWALANDADKAMKTLEKIEKSDKISPADVNAIEADKDFVSLHSDKKWKSTIEELREKANSNYNIEEIIYGRKDGVALTMLHLKPKGNSNGKTVIWVMAGSWYSSYQQAERSVRPSAMYLDKGFNVFLVILGSQPRYAIPDEINDVKRAVRYIRYNAGKFKIDPNKFGIHGGSAGGHLSLAVAMADEKIDTTATDPIDRMSSRVQAAAVLYPPTDFMNWGVTGGNMVNAGDLLKGAGVYGAFDYRVWNNKTRTFDFVKDTSERNKMGRESSPIYAISSDDPPVFIIHGDADKTVPIQQSETFVAKLKEAAVPNKFIIKKGGDHNPNDMMPELKDFVDWFDKNLK
ncbi:MAG: prolyl oligopeptidase family serine peptidase [Chitinophagaceae bacterium]|nr:prolyl oligopeptidase family serine peptidase [Chitinophagaceae bacterium]